MRARISPRPLAVLALAAVLSACSDSGPTSPGDLGADQISTGAYVLRITSGCSFPADPRILSLVHSRVTLSRSGSDWIATASSAAAGDVELRFVVTSGIPGVALNLTGTIKGTALHMPELTTVPIPETRVNFGGDGRAAISGVAFGVTAITPVAGLDGIGTGTITLTDSAGQSCTTSAFSWGMSRS